ncbi:hypothetical protein MIT9_P0207 [Methylomarinovum caldicuralii]|uniref:Calcineurin-like phosphoesterase domain-containing protein n=1 Tax=Methylomarinovum caldicuralii TaxID=438856 RepID=A0AAU9CLB0_9GAMM|nr:metallophosphoesterase [Methylomarinovum caldicuralii]BCX80633.1 hypothetical protein MIT9_P0207 [Methylomarinovum caldicuralii]
MKILLLLLGLVAIPYQLSHADSQENRFYPSRLKGEAFSFALIGDLPYGDDQVARFDKLVENVNRDPRVKFVLHTGDIKGGGERCDDERILARFRQYQQFTRAFVYTPGDNEWTDCHRVSNGSFNPLERLAFLRQVFFSDPDRSSGGHPIFVHSQARMPGFETFIENVWFQRAGVVFGTVHVVGSNNDLKPWLGFDPADSVDNPRADRIAEFEQRRDAAIAWLDQIFDQAERHNAKGVFLVMQANPRFDLPEDDPARAGFKDIIDHLRARVADFGKPVVLAHGDFHEYLVDKPFDSFEDNPRLPNFTRVQTFGSPRVNWIKVHVLPNTSAVFLFEQQILADPSVQN